MKINERINTRTNKAKNINKVKKTIRKNKGGAPDGIKFIGRGAYGCVYSPGLKCLDKDHIQDPKIKTISKLMTNDNSYLELIENIVLDILEYDNEYKFHIPLPTKCVIDIKSTKQTKENQNSNNRKYKYEEKDFADCDMDKIKKDPNPTILTYQDGGIDLYKLSTSQEPHLKLHSHPENIFSENGLPKILDSIIALQEKGLIHGDIKDQNIVTGFFDDSQNPGSTDFKLIDFGLLTFTGEINIDSYLSTKPHISPEIIEIINNKDILSGQTKKYINKIFQYSYIYYPVYGFLFYIDNIDKLEMIKIKSIVNIIFNKFENTINKYSTVDFFFKLMKYDKRRIIDNLLILFNELKNSYIKDDKTEYNKLCLILAKKIDYYSFAIILLIYIHHIQNNFPKLETIISKHIYLFLNNSKLLFINSQELKPEDVKTEFNAMCKNILSDINKENPQKGGVIEINTMKNNKKNEKELSINNIKKLISENTKQLDNNIKKSSNTNNPKSFSPIKNEITPQLMKAIDEYLK